MTARYFAIFMSTNRVYHPRLKRVVKGRLPNDVRTALIASGEHEMVLLAKLLLLKSDLATHSPRVDHSRRKN